MGPTIKDVARRAGVAVSSVSRALNGHPDVSDSLRERVLAAANEIGYQPNRMAQGLRSGSTRAVGFVIRDISNPLFAEIAKGTEERLRESEYSVLLTNSEGDPSLDADSIDLLNQRMVDAIILCSASESDPATLDAIRRAETPIVLLDRELPYQRVSTVKSDHEGGSHAAVTDLMELGHERIALVSGSQDLYSSRSRLAGYIAAHREFLVEVDRDLVALGEYTYDYGFTQINRLLAMNRPPTAVVVGGVQTTLGALQSIHELGVHLGRDLSFVACDEVGMLHLITPSLSVVRRDAYEMGAVAAELVIDALEHSAGPTTKVLPTEYVRRDSVAAYS